MFLMSCFKWINGNKGSNYLKVLKYHSYLDLAGSLRFENPRYN